MREKLKIGLLLDNFNIQSWEYRVLESIIDSDFGQISLILLNDSVPIPGNYPEKTVGNIILNLHERIDKMLFRNSTDYSCLVDSSEFLKTVEDVEVLRVEDSIEKIKRCKLDIILNLSINSLNIEISKLTRYGIWSYFKYKSQPAPGYMEVVKKIPVTGSYVQIVGFESIKPTLICCSLESTYIYSVNVNRNKLFWRASLFIPRMMKALYLYGDNYLNNLIEKSRKNDNVVFEDHPASPTFLQALWYLLKFLLVTIRQTVKKVCYTDAFNWMLFYRIKEDNDILLSSFCSFKRIKHPKDRFWADPFVESFKDKYYVFVEELIYKTNKGHIAVLELDKNGNFLSSEVIINKPYHLSYPFIFMTNDCYFMIPESSQNRTIELYKCVEFPRKWEFTKNMMEGLSAVDTTLFLYKNKWWLFTSIDGTGGISGSSTELFLFYSDDIFSDNWKSHPCNPIISDVRTARPAGRIFLKDGKIYRPSQDCSVRYGKGFNINQITLLSETAYEEVLIQKIEPFWNKRLKGAHTFNFIDDFTIIDSYSYRTRLPL